MFELRMSFDYQGGSLMARSTNTPQSSRTHRITAIVHHGHNAFPFELCIRPLRFGPNRTISYAWMDSTDFRLTKSRRGHDHTNIRSCLGHWWATRRTSGLYKNPHEICHLLLAASYPVLSGGKAAHQVFRDAHLRAIPTKLVDAALPDKITRRVRQVVRSRDRNRVDAELGHLLGSPDPVSAKDTVAMQQAFDGIMSHGVELVRTRDIDGVWQFMGMVDVWAAAKRKKGNQGWLRTFLNRFGYECKAAFYTCYANAWIDIIPKLRQEHGLNQVSEQFLRFWHAQNQPREGTDGNLIPDVFRGQVLALHPLSGFFMKDPAMLAIAGKFFGTAAHDRVFVHGEAAVPAYWKLVGGILTAGHQYRQALERQEAGRGATRSTADPATTVVSAEGELSTERLFEEYATSRCFRCRHCQGKLRCCRVTPAKTGANTCSATFGCKSCGKETSKRIRYEDLKASFREQK